MSHHLTDEQIAASVAGLELGDEAREHLDSCLGCRSSVSEMLCLIEKRRGLLAAGEPDWEAQRAGVLAGLDGHASRRRRPGWLTPALAVAAALVMAVAVGLVGGPGGATIPRDEIALEEILAEAETLLADRSIPGFELIDPDLDEFGDYLSGEGVNGGTS
jgi:hypothetical protein